MLKCIRNPPVSEEIAQNLTEAEKNGNTMRINTFANFLEKVVSKCHHFCESCCVGRAIKERYFVVSWTSATKQIVMWEGKLVRFSFVCPIPPEPTKAAAFPVS